GDGKLSKEELPRGWTVAARPASVEAMAGGSAGVVDDNVVVFEASFDIVGGRAVTRSLPAGVPEWVRHMGRQGAGDVSVRAFTGPPALFKKIDTDGDGLISPAEAAAFERVSRKGK